jgi:hypothetical protein
VAFSTWTGFFGGTLETLPFAGLAEADAQSGAPMLDIRLEI